MERLGMIEMDLRGVRKEQLRLRSNKTFTDLAEEAVYVLWNDPNNRLPSPPMDPHRYAEFTKAWKGIFARRIATCEACADPALWDSWARTGGGIPTEPQTPAICAQHTQRFEEELGAQLTEILLELEHTAREFITPEFQGQLHLSIQSVLKPFLIKNLATRYCDRCEKEFRAKSVPGRTTP